MPDIKDERPEKFADVVLPENYIKHSPVTAEIVMNEQHRVMALDTVFLSSLHQFIRQNYGEHYSSVLYKTGFHWGDQAYQSIEKLALSVYSGVKSIKELSMPQFHRLFTNHLAAMGWGNFELKRRDDFLFVDLYDSLVVESLKTHEKNGTTVCDLYAGFFAGIFSRISNMPLACLEITCTIEGYEFCSFLLDNEETIGQLKQYVGHGMTPLEAFQKLKKEIGETV
ncbi:hypothetical protein HUU42_01405 [bacterium]|nr:hypothetical protein [bacterium]